MISNPVQQGLIDYVWITITLKDLSLTFEILPLSPRIQKHIGKAFMLTHIFTYAYFCVISCLYLSGYCYALIYNLLKPDLHRRELLLDFLPPCSCLEFTRGVYPCGKLSLSCCEWWKWQNQNSCKNRENEKINSIQSGIMWYP